MSQLYELSIELTNECTLSCLHCSSGSVPQKGPNELELHEHLRLLKEAKELGAECLSLSGGNPLLYKDLLSLISAAMELHYQRVLLYTTGHNHYGPHIYDYPYLKPLCVPGLTFIFSLHSHDPATNDLIMNTPGAWVDIVDSISWLIGSGVDVEIHMVPMKPNFRHIKQMRDFCKDLGVKKLSLLRFVPQTRGATNLNQLGLTISDFARIQLTLDDLMDDKEHPVAIRAGCPIDFRHSVGLLDKKSKPCHAGDDLMLVRPDGSVHPCAAWKSLEVDSNVRRYSLFNIWNHSHVFNEIREFKKTDYKDLQGPCSDCTMLPSCKGGCLAQRLHAYGKTLDAMYIDKSDPLCPSGGK